jgi:hypothetical protein
MDKTEQDFLLEAKKEIASLKERIAALEARISEMQEKADETPAESAEVDFTDVDLGVADPIPPISEPEPVEDPEPVSMPVFEEPAAPEPEPAPAPQPLSTVPETNDYAWSKDKPGILVKNIRSGISLLDRAQFIGTLFKEDFALYDSTIAALNELNSLDEAVAYVKEHFPQWNLGSDVAYRFMMAIRKKLG